MSELELINEHKKDYMTICKECGVLVLFDLSDADILCIRCHYECVDHPKYEFIRCSKDHLIPVAHSGDHPNINTIRLFCGACREHWKECKCEIKNM